MLSGMETPNKPKKPQKNKLNIFYNVDEVLSFACMLFNVPFELFSFYRGVLIILGYPVVWTSTNNNVIRYDYHQYI